MDLFKLLTLLATKLQLYHGFSNTLETLKAIFIKPHLRDDKIATGFPFMIKAVIYDRIF